MVDERTAYWGARDAARYRTQDDDPTGGDYVVAETLDANGDPVDVLLRWDDTAGEWVSGGPVNMNGSDVTNVGALDANSVSTEQLGSGRHYAGAYSGNDPDARLDAALSAASVGDKIYLEVGTYGSDRTISNAIDIEGAVSTFSESTFLNSCVWTFDAPVSVSQIGAGGPDDVEFNANTDGCCFTNISQNTLTINFATGTDGGVADSIYSSEGRSATVNDPDGNNLIGDVY